MICISILIATVSFVLYAIFEPEKDTYNGFSGLFFIKFVIKFIYRSMCHRKQGVLNLHKDLIYVADGGSTSMRIQPKNHRISVKGVRINSMNLKNYRTLCGYNRYDAGVPVCYAETLFIKGLFHIITSSKFCLSPMGVIHLRQTVSQIEPLDKYLDATFTLNLSVQEYRQLHKGIEVDVKLQLIPNDRRPIWEGVATFFSRGPSARSKAMRNQSFSREENEDSCEDVTNLDVPGDCGLKYARITSDWNPFHLYKWSAQLFGFRLPIAHGLWTLSKALSVIQSKVDLYGEQVEVSCAFKRPLFMPGRASIKIDNLEDIDTEEGSQITVEERDTGIPHMKAQIKIL